MGIRVDSFTTLENKIKSSATKEKKISKVGESVKSESFLNCLRPVHVTREMSRGDEFRVLYALS